MQAQTTKKMMALVRCLSPLRWFQYKEQLSVTLTNLLMMKKKKITGIQLTVLVLFLAVQKEKKKKSHASSLHSYIYFNRHISRQFGSNCIRKDSLSI